MFRLRNSSLTNNCCYMSEYMYIYLGELLVLCCAISRRFSYWNDFISSTYFYRMHVLLELCFLFIRMIYIIPNLWDHTRCYALISMFFPLYVIVLSSLSVFSFSHIVKSFCQPYCDFIRALNISLLHDPTRRLTEIVIESANYI